MPRVAVVTDSNSGITVEEGRQLGVEVVPMPVLIDGKIYYEGVDLTQEEFYQKQVSGADIATSQPAPGDVIAVWKKALEGHDQLVYIPMSAGLSASCATAQMLAENFDGRVQVADNRRISVTQRYSVLDALAMTQTGMDAAQIRQILEEQGDDSCIYISVDTLKYLRKGGRVTGAEAIAGTMLNIKPVLQIQGEKIDAYAKVRGMHQAVEKMLDAICDDITGRFNGMNLHVGTAYSGDPEIGLKWQKYVQSRLPRCRVHSAPLSLSIACHTGPGAIGIGCFYYEK